MNKNPLFFENSLPVPKEYKSDPFLNFCTDREIIKELVNIKLKRIQQRRLKLSEAKFTGTTAKVNKKLSNNRWDRIFSLIFPSRKEVSHPKKQKRTKIIRNNKKIGLITDESTIFKFALKATIYKKNFKNSDNLEEFCRYIRSRIGNIEDTGINTPDIIPKLKNPETNDFRIICHYEEIESLILSLFVKYLISIYDPQEKSYFKDCAIAFRNRTNWNHTYAFGKLLDYLESKREEKVYFFEYDIKKFFDTLNHLVVLKEYQKMLNSQKGILSRLNNKEDLSAIILKRYISSYSMKQALEKIINSRESSVVRYKDMAKKYLEEVSSSKPCGIPQGTSLSCFLSNVVLSSIDRKMDKLFKNKDGLFLRYCDDIIVVSTNVRYLKKAEKIYRKTLDKLDLIMHKIERIRYIDDKKKYWSSKSRPISLWGDPQKFPEASPFISFLGYQISYKYQVFIRPSSLNKEIAKQQKIAKKAIQGASLYKKSGAVMNITSGALINAVVSRLTAMSVGYLNIAEEHGKSGKCWIDAWELFYKRPYLSLPYSQLKQLDKGRIRAIGRVYAFAKQNPDVFKTLTAGDLLFSELKKGRKNTENRRDKKFGYKNAMKYRQDINKTNKAPQVEK